MCVSSAAPAFAQSVTYNHDDAKMNQITVAEIGSGGLTPALYYDLLHKNYQKSAAEKNKLGLRTAAGIAAFRQVEDAEKIDSAMSKRAQIEALNIADRSVDIAWLAEGEKVKAKLKDFERNIQRIVPCGGSSKKHRLWVEIYRLLLASVKSTHEGYMPNSQRKKQYLKTYADACRHNEALVKYLAYLANAKAASSLLSARLEKEDKNGQHASSALGRWREAAWRTGCGASQPAGAETRPR